MRRLEQRAPDPVGPATLAEAVGLTAPSTAPAPRGPVPTQAATQPTALDRLGGLLGLDDDDASAPAAAKDTAATPLPLGSVVARVPLARPPESIRTRTPPRSSARALDQARAAECGAPDRRAGRADRAQGSIRRAPSPRSLIRLGARPDQLDGRRRRQRRRGAGRIWRNLPLRESSARPADSRGRRNVLGSRAHDRRRLAEIFADRTHERARVPPHPAPAALCVRRGQPAEGGGAGGRQGHHRSRHGQPRQPDAGAHRREAGRDGARRQDPPLLDLARHPGPAQGLGRLLRRAASASASTPRPRSASRWAPRRGWPTSPRRSRRRATRSSSPNPSYPIHPFGFIIAGASIRHVPFGPGIDLMRELARAAEHSVPAPDHGGARTSRRTRPR